ncbi:MAG TPA: preprotein translocase subunit SecE [Candidatus Andersenbacteria bacterium]|nr:preprotein translocase subunit SecE [Candidatus Andersenbacteria bacterium]
MAKQVKISVMNLPRAAWQFIREAREELKKVSWPDRTTTIRYTIIVVAASLVMGAVVGGIDYIFTLLLELVL